MVAFDSPAADAKEEKMRTGRRFYIDRSRKTQRIFDLIAAERRRVEAISRRRYFSAASYIRELMEDGLKWRQFMNTGGGRIDAIDRRMGLPVLPMVENVVIPRLDAYHLDGLLGLTVAEAYSTGQITLNDVVNAVLSAEKLKMDVALDPLLSSRVDSILAGFLQNSSDK